MKNGWQTKTLDQIASNLDSRRVPITKGVRKSGEYPYYGASGIVDYVADYIFDEDALLISEDGANLLARSTPIAFPASGKYWVNNHAHIVKFDSPTTQRFVELYLNNIPLDAYITGAAQPKLNQKALNTIPIPIPLLSEQQRIVDALDEALGILATVRIKVEKNLRYSRSLFESHLQFVLTQRGPNWREKRLDEICTFSSGGTPSKSNNSFWNGKIPWVSGRDMKSTRLADSQLHISQAAVDESATRMAPVGALLILVRGMGLAHGAQIAELMVPCAFNQDIRGIHAIPDLLPRFLLFALRDRINSSDTVLSNAAHGTLKIDSDELQKVRIGFPPLEQQQKIVETIDQIDKETRHLAQIYKRKIVALGALRKSLLDQAFNGHISASP